MDMMAPQLQMGHLEEVAYGIWISQTRYTCFYGRGTEMCFLQRIISIVGRVEVDPDCPMCSMEPESVLHCFVLCLAARAVWLGCPLSLQATDFNIDSFASFFDIVNEVMSKD